MEEKEENTSELYKTKNEYIKKRIETAKRVFFKEPDQIARIRSINLNFNPSIYKCMYPFNFFIIDKEIVPKEITDKYYLLEEEYKRLGIRYSPFLLVKPNDLNQENKKKEKDEFDYYKRHILLENYDEEIESPEKMKELIEQYKVLLNP